MRLPDGQARIAARRELGTTFLVEAGAGTGKTTVLVDRFIACLLDEEGTIIEQVAAITFTDKAAGELRQRVRRRLEGLLADPEGGGADFGDLDAARCDRLRVALGQIEAAPISTIHSFAARLLRERPVEACVDPAFGQLDALGSELLRERLWDDWLASVVDQAPSGGAGVGADISVSELLTTVLQAEVSIKALRALAMVVFARRYEIVEPDLPVEPQLAAVVAELRHAGTTLAATADRCISVDDGLLLSVQKLLAAIAELPDGTDLHETGAALVSVAVGKYGAKNLGRQENWGGKQGKAEMLAGRDELRERVVAAAALYQAYIADLSVAVAWRFTRYAGERQLALGQLDFADLLGKARGMLLQPGPRRFFQKRFRYLLVDEFQDTDPLQAELVFLLAERETTTRPWQEVELLPGKLFLVGDPKQSIYRFRGADIDTYRRVRSLIAASPQARVLGITTNFRTVPSIVSWVNGAFAGIFAAGANGGAGAAAADAYSGAAAGSGSALPADYANLDVARAQADPTSHVRVLEAPISETPSAEAPSSAEKPNRSEVRHHEAAVIADWLGSVFAGALPVCDREGGVETARPATPGDVTILLPTFTGIDVYERALRHAGIPYRIEGGRTFFQRREVRDTVLGLRAIADASSPLAVYAALHSSLFGFSDDDLFAFHLAGGRFDYLVNQDDVDLAAHPVAGHPAAADIVAALAGLHMLHEQRNRRPLAETLDELLRVTNFVELQAAWGDGPEQAVGNLGKLVAMVATFADESQATFHGLVRYLGDAVTKADVAESPVGEDGEFVRLTTIHKAKGLEFAIVVLADALGAAGGGRGGDGVKTRLDSSTGVLDCSLRSQAGSGDGGFMTAGFAAAEIRENAAKSDERRRLAYVACTRAADHLVIPVVAPSTSDESLMAYLEPYLGVAAPEAVTIETWQATSRGPVAASLPVDVEVLWQRREDWRRERAAALRAAAQPALVTAPSKLESLSFASGDDDGECGEWPAAVVGELPIAGTDRRRALALGSAVHRVLELVPLTDPAALSPGGVLEKLATDAATEQGLPDLAARVFELAAACWQSPPLRAAAAASVCHRELPVAAVIDGVIVEGYIDLLYGDEQGYVVVDYKTDQQPDLEVVRAQYELQGGAYALAVEQATGAPVREVVFVLAAAASPAVATGTAATTGCANGDSQSLASALVRVVFDENLRQRVRARVALAVAEVAL